MLVEIILASVSIVFILFLITMRYFSLAYAKGQSSFLNKTDSKISSLWLWSRKAYRNTVEDITDLFKDIPHISLQILNKILYFLYKKTKRLIDLIKGNRINTEGGSVSLYLKKIEK